MMTLDIPGNGPKQFLRNEQKSSEKGKHVILFSLSPGVPDKSESRMKGQDISWSTCVTVDVKNTKLKQLVSNDEALNGLTSQAWTGSKRILETLLHGREGRGEQPASKQSHIAKSILYLLI